MNFLDEPHNISASTEIELQIANSIYHNTPIFTYVEHRERWTNLALLWLVNVPENICVYYIYSPRFCLCYQRRPHLQVRLPLIFAEEGKEEEEEIPPNHKHIWAFIGERYQNVWGQIRINRKLRAIVRKFHRLKTISECLGSIENKLETMST